MKGKILMFHRVLPAEEITFPNAYWDRGTLVSLAFFEKLIAHLSEQKKLVQVLSQCTEDSESIVLTFDDGYLDNYKHALPVLERYGFKATFFPVMEPCLSGQNLPLDEYYHVVDHLELDERERADLIGGRRKEAFLLGSLAEKQGLIVDLQARTEGLPDLPCLYMDAEQLQVLLAKGHEIGGHSMAHDLLTELHPESLKSELAKNAAALRRLSGGPPFSFAYPDGRYNESVVAALEVAGFQRAVTVKESKGGRYELGRVFVREGFNYFNL